jgi:hypothetical protein
MAKRFGARRAGNHGGGLPATTAAREERKKARRKAERAARGLLRAGRPWRPTRRLQGKQPPGVTRRAAKGAAAVALAAEAWLSAQVVQAGARAAAAKELARAAVAEVRAAEVSEARSRAAVAEAQAREDFAEGQARAADALAARAKEETRVAHRLALAVGPSRALAATRPFPLWLGRV